MSFVASVQLATTKLAGFRTAVTQAGASAGELGAKVKVAEAETGGLAKQAGGSPGVFGKFKSALGLASEGTKEATGGMKGLNQAMKDNMIGLLMMLLAPLIQKLVDLMTHSKLVQAVVQKTFEVIGEVVGTVSKFVKGVIETVWPYVLGIFKTVVGSIVEQVKAGFEFVKNLILIPMAIVKGEIKTTWDIISGIFQIAMDLLTGKVGKAWGDIKNTISNVVNDVADTLRSVWNGLAGIAKAAFEGVLAVIRDPINGIIRLVNSAIDGLDSIHISIPSWIPGIGGKSFGVDIPHIPTLAEGGIVLPRPGGTLALVAEGGQSEAVLPLSKLSALLAAQRGPVFGAAGTGGGFTITNYYESNNGSARRTAEELMFLAKARG